MLMCIVTLLERARVHIIFHTYLASDPFVFGSAHGTKIHWNSCMLGNAISKSRIRFKTIFWARILQITDDGVCY